LRINLLLKITFAFVDTEFNEDTNVGRIVIVVYQDNNLLTIHKLENIPARDISNLEITAINTAHTLYGNANIFTSLGGILSRINEEIKPLVFFVKQSKNQASIYLNHNTISEKLDLIKFTAYRQKIQSDLYI